MVVPLAVMVRRSFDVGDGWSLDAWRQLGGVSRRGISIGVDVWASMRPVAALRRGRRGPGDGRRRAGGAGDHRLRPHRSGARRRDDAAARHVGGDDRLRHAPRLRPRRRSTGGRRGGWCRSARRWWPRRSSCACSCRRCGPIPADLRAAAATLGASPVRAWLAVDGRAVVRPLAAGAGFAAAISLGEFGATTFLTRTGRETLPIAVGTLARPAGRAQPGPGLRHRDGAAGAHRGRPGDRRRGGS